MLRNDGLKPAVILVVVEGKGPLFILKKYKNIFFIDMFFIYL
jgi:hypothetical protein